MTFEQFAAAYRQAFDTMNTYTLDQVGHGHYLDQMVELADAYPEFLERLETEIDEAHYGPKE